ncbi:hypothetical protein LTR53_017761, partial [Teratosphaeriaceae sp. CCFEE 6253]
LRVTAARPGVVNFELDIQKEHTVSNAVPGSEILVDTLQNRLNILHGGTLAFTYLSSGGKVGDLIRAEVTCDKFGKTLAYTSIRFMNAKDELVARGSHTKYVALAWKDPQNITDELSPKPEKSE